MSTNVSFINVRLCKGGQLVESLLTVSQETGKILSLSELSAGVGADLKGGIIAPGFLEIQTNGLRGFHFTHFEDKERYEKKLDEVARYLPSTGVTGFLPTIPTVASDDFKKILPSLKPREIDCGATVLGAHAEGPYLHPSKKGAHNASLFQVPTTPPIDIYGSLSNIKIVTLAPELPDSTTLIKSLTNQNIRVSLGHSSATLSEGEAAIQAGATCLTHTLNAMAPLHHRDPGLAGLITASSSEHEPPFFSIIADGNHLHPNIATMLYRSSPSKCILTTDSIELAGLPDGTYHGHAQIPHNQTKLGSRVVIEGTETLIGGCASLSECVQNLISWSGCSVAEAVRCVTENVADFLGLEDRGRLEVGRRADFVILDENGGVRETWVGGHRVWQKEKEGVLVG